MSGPTQIPLEELPDWARAAMSARKPTPGPARVAITDELRRHAGWPLLLDAAVVSAFLPRDLAPREAIGEPRAVAERLVLQFAQPASTKSGAAWQLTREARSAVLDLAIRGGDLATAFARTAERFEDKLSVALRDTLSNQPLNVSESEPLEALESRRAAISLVATVPGLTLPTIDELDRNIRRRRIIEQFERMCGKDYETRIVGRDDELEKLRGFVGSIGPSIGNVLNRAISNVRRTIAGRGTFVIWGTGGVGKTTLISRFMLEHIEAADKTFPFAYLDFDRPSVSPRDPFGLFAEICLQVSSQFERLDEPMRALRAQILAEQPREFDPGASPDPPEALVLLASKFRSSIHEFLDSEEHLFEWERPLLLVFDTFEVVQYDRQQVDLLQKFVRMLRGPQGIWTRLRLIISGRRNQPDFIGVTESHELEGLDLDGAQTLLSRWTRRVDKPISDGSARALARSLGIKKTRFDHPRVHPLRLTMVVELFRTSKQTNGDEIAAALVSELTADYSGESAVGRQLIDGILIRRIIEHINDPRVKRLADPGLVVRRITPDMIQFVMAPGSPAPGVTPPRDSVDFERWKVDDEEAKSIFKAFEKEGTLVEHEGSALRHRQDVRSEMLPLIRASSRKRFELLHQLAFDHLMKSAEGDDAAAAEAIYHGLWLNRPLEELDALWARLKIDPRIDPEEFPEDSLAAIYLRSRNRERLELAEVTRLPQSVASRWVMTFGEQFLASSRPNEDVAIVRVACGERFQLLKDRPDIGVVVMQLLFRAGLWREARGLIQWLRHEKLGPTHETVLVRTWVNLAATTEGNSRDLELVEREKLLFKVTDPAARAEIMAYYLLGMGRRAVEPGERELRGLFAATAMDLMRDGRISLHALRLSVLASDSPPRELLSAWVMKCSRLPRDPGIAPPLVRIFDTLAAAGHENARADAKRVRALAGGKQPARAALDDLDETWHRYQQNIANYLSVDPSFARRIRAIMVFDHSEWHQLIGHSLERELERSDSRLAGTLRENGFIGMSGSARDTADVALQRARENGRFLELVHLLADPIDARRDLEAGLSFKEFLEATQYPQSVAGVAIALKGWHEYLVGRFAGHEPPDSKSAPKPKPKGKPPALKKKARAS